MAILPFVTRKAIEGWLRVVAYSEYEIAVKGIHWAFCNGFLVSSQGSDHCRMVLFKTRSMIIPVVLCCQKDYRSKADPEYREFRVLDVREPSREELMKYERALAETGKKLG